MIPVSVVIIVKNGIEHIEACLKSLALFDEIVVYDNGSVDGTVEVCQKFKNVTLVEGEFFGFGPTKNHAVSLAKHKWVFSLDSDEIVTEALVEEIRSLLLDEEKVYAVKRDNYYGKRVIQCCGWENDYVLRLFCKEKVQFNHKQVHEGLVLNGAGTEKLRHSLKHFSFKSAEELIHKMQQYSTLYALENKGRKKSSSLKAFGRALFSFVKNYIFQKGFLYGYEGLIISVSNANGVFYKYIKLLEENRK